MVLFAAMMLVFISGVYIGFALVEDPSFGREMDIALAAIFVVWAFVSLLGSVHQALKLLMIAFVFHATVDLLHGVSILPSNVVPHWYPWACALYDTTIAIILGWRFTRQADT